MAVKGEASFDLQMSVERTRGSLAERLVLIEDVSAHQGEITTARILVEGLVGQVQSAEDRVQDVRTTLQELTGSNKRR